MADVYEQKQLNAIIELKEEPNITEDKSPDQLPEKRRGTITQNTENMKSNISSVYEEDNDEIEKGGNQNQRATDLQMESINFESVDVNHQFESMDKDVKVTIATLKSADQMTIVMMKVSNLRSLLKMLILRKKQKQISKKIVNYRINRIETRIGLISICRR